MVLFLIIFLYLFNFTPIYIFYQSVIFYLLCSCSINMPVINEINQITDQKAIVNWCRLQVCTKVNTLYGYRQIKGGAVVDRPPPFPTKILHFHKVFHEIPWVEPPPFSCLWCVQSTSGNEDTKNDNHVMNKGKFQKSAFFTRFNFV